MSTQYCLVQSGKTASGGCSAGQGSSEPVAPRINLLNVISKVFYRIILNHIVTIIDLKLRPEQAGFRPNRSCVDQINSLRIIIEQAVEWQSLLYLTFIDYKKAFVSVDWECIWIALREVGLPVKIVNIIKEGYNMSNCRVLHDGQMSPPFDTVSGVKARMSFVSIAFPSGYG
jgi:hypothetical protein